MNAKIIHMMNSKWSNKAGKSKKKNENTQKEIRMARKNQKHFHLFCKNNMVVAKKKIKFFSGKCKRTRASEGSKVRGE